MSRSTERIDAITKMILNGFSVNYIMRAEGLKEDTIRRYVDWSKDDGLLPKDTKIVGDLFIHGETGQPISVTSGSSEKIDKQVSDKGMCVTTKSTDIRTVEDALVRAGVDLEEWEIDKYSVTSREIETKRWEYQEFDRHNEPLWTVKVWLKKKKLDIAKAVQHIADAFRGKAPTYIPIDKPWGGSGVMCEIEFPDLHLGKHSWGRQTGVDYDRKIAIECFEKATNELLSIANGLEPELILIPLGNDLIHVDNLENSTTRGTRQDTDGRYQLIFENALEMLVGFINKARQIADVQILVVPGNHDELASYHLGAALAGRYYDAPDVSIDNEPKTRKYYRWGINLLGFVHGGKDDPGVEKLPLLMANEAEGNDWSETTHREWHVGHTHKRQAIQWMTTDSDMGVHYRVLPSLSATDAWHYRHGFVGQLRVASMFVWCKKRGFRAEFNSTPVGVG